MEVFSKIIFLNVRKLIDTSLSVLKIFFFAKWNVTLPITKNKNCIVIANGPSFNEIYNDHAQLLKENDCLVTNRFADSELFSVIKPIYYVMLDPFMLDANNAEVNTTYSILVKHVDWKMTLFIPFAFKGKGRTNMLLENKNLNIQYFNYYYFKGFEKIGFRLYHKNLACPRSLSVINVSLFLAVNLGYKSICLAGADQNWFKRIIVDEENILRTGLDHFYDGSNKAEFKPYYRAGNPNNETVKMAEFFWIQMKTFEGYDQVAAYAKWKSTEIFNVSIHSYIDAFKKQNLATILKK